ncbi:hypothetical protein AB0O32_21375 [Streptomyces rubiginosohelvolus]|uniref:hypothetical protein n=1 Tax=Streptomyces rubiginosohelvolus TaxID=67362 RepID=UPI0034143061
MPGWKTVVNPQRGIAFDVPVDWAVKSSGWVTYVAENGDPEETPLVGFAAPAILKEKWCRSDDDGNGTQEDTPLASWAPGRARRPRHRRSGPGERPPVRLRQLRPAGEGEGRHRDREAVHHEVRPHRERGDGHLDRCRQDRPLRRRRQATAFAFENPAGETLSWTFVGVRGVDDEVPEPTVRKILGTVRLVDGAP